MPAEPTRTAHPPAALPAMNGLLTRLPRDVQQRLIALSTRVSLRKDASLAEAGSPVTSVYLPCSGLVSLQTMTQYAESVEIAMVGKEGIAGLPLASAAAVAPHTSVVVIPGEAYRLRVDAWQTEFERSTSLQRAVVQYWQVMMIEIAQGSACHRFHTARQRLARWLLSASDRTQSLRIEMTHERLAQSLGLQRTRVTLASLALQDAGAIKSRRGRITILDRRRVETLACECYRQCRDRAAE